LVKNKKEALPATLDNASVFEYDVVSMLRAASNLIFKDAIAPFILWE
jgi:hypothetical protein